MTEIINYYSTFLDRGKATGLLTSRGVLGKSRASKKKLKEIEEYINELRLLTDFAPQDYTTVQRMQLVRAGITKDNIECPVCKKPRVKTPGMTKFLSTCGEKDTEHNDYRHKHSHDALKVVHSCIICGAPKTRAKHITCGADDEEHNAYRKKLYLENREKTWIKKYGVQNIKQHPDIKKKAAETTKNYFLETYGVNHPNMLPEFKDKVQKNNIMKYGVNHPNELPELKAKALKNNIKKYGVRHPMQLPEFRSKSRVLHLSDEYQKRVNKNNLAKYGVLHPNMLPEFKAKVQENNLAKYGVLHPNMLPEFKNKVQANNITKYGVRHPMQLPELKAKVVQSNLVEYGVDYPMQLPEFKAKVLESNLKKYGVCSPNKLPEFKAKVLESNLKKYGVCSPAQNHYNKKNFSMLSKVFIEENFITPRGYFLNGEFCAFVNCTAMTAYNIAKDFDVDYIRMQGQSSAEYSIIEFIKLLAPNTDIIHGSRKIISPLELDIYLPEYNLAIEYNGNLFHTAGDHNWPEPKNIDQMKNKHLIKYKKCKEKNISLIQIPEFSYNHDELFWQELIAMHLGVLKFDSSERILPMLHKNDSLVWSNDWGNPPIGWTICESYNPRCVFLPGIFSSINKQEIPRTIPENNKLYFDSGSIMIHKHDS